MRDMDAFEATTRVLRVAAVLGTLIASAGVAIGFLAADQPLWLAITSGIGIAWVEAITWTVVFRTRDAARGRSAISSWQDTD